MPILAYFLARFSEPSSYAGLGALLAVLGWQLSDPALAQVVQLLAAGCGLVALCLKERGWLRAVVLVVAVTPALSACGGLPPVALAGLGTAGSAYAAVAGLAQTASPYITAACGEYARARSLADTAVGTVLPAGVAAKLAAVESFGDAACAAPPGGDPLSTAIWLGRVAGQVATLAAEN